MTWGLKRYQARQLHYVTFTCYHRADFLVTPRARDIFVQTLERARCWYEFYIVGYVVMPEHVHLLLSEPERATLALALQMLKQTASRSLKAIAWPAKGIGAASPAFARSGSEFYPDIPRLYMWTKGLSSEHQGLGHKLPGHFD